ncbi:Nadh-cytochrome b5 reductase, partial [Globisporangium splendens]
MDALVNLAGGDVRIVIGVAVVLATTLLLVVSGALKPRNKALVTLQPPAVEGGNPPTVHLPLIEKESLSHDTRRFRFALPSEKHVLGLPVGQHISLRYTDSDGKLVMRSYTPVSSDDALGYVDLVVKVYFKDVHPKFPEGGKMSQHLESLKIGETIEVSGPKGKLSYMGKGEIHIKHRVRDPAPEIRVAKKIGMIAGGTGITPMLQIIRRALQNPEYVRIALVLLHIGCVSKLTLCVLIVSSLCSDKTEFYLLFANQSEQDILCREEIDAMVQNHANVHAHYTIDRASDGWKHSVGFVNAEMIKNNLPPAAADVQIFMCGPPPMLKFAVLPALEELGFTPNQHFSF